MPRYASLYTDAIAIDLDRLSRTSKIKNFTLEAGQRDDIIYKYENTALYENIMRDIHLFFVEFADVTVLFLISRAQVTCDAMA